MKKYIVLLLLLLLFTNMIPVFADFVRYNDTFSRNIYPNSSPRVLNRFKDNYPRPVYRKLPSVNLSKKNINALEKYALNRTYRNDSDLDRLIRLENLAFGATQIGDINTRFNNVEQAILARPKDNFKRSTLNNLANYFIGQSTGFTPSLFPNPNYNNLGGFNSNPYIPGYSNHNIESFSNGIFGGGWGYSGHDFGNGTSIKIID